MSQFSSPPKVRVQRTLYRRLVFRRLFYVQLAKIVAQKLLMPDTRDRVFISRIGGIGDLINIFPVVERLSERNPVEMGTGPDPYRILVQNNPHVQKVHSPFVYKPNRRAHQKVIQHLLKPFYKRVILLDTVDSRWWSHGKHFSEVVAEQCGFPPQAKGILYLSQQNRMDGAAYLKRHALREFIYVAQLIRHRRPFRSWPLAYYHKLFRMVRDRFSHPILVDTTGSDETDIPNFCRRLDRLDILTAAAVIERAHLFIGPDSGLAHVAGALGVPTVSIHLGYPPEWCRVLGDNVRLVRQERPFDDPVRTSPEEVFTAIKEMM